MNNLFIYDILDSTMNQASKLAESFTQKSSLPFAVLAHEQSSGRGTHGRSWMSEKGGLYLTVVTSLSDFHPMMITFIPLYAAIVLNQWIFETFQIRTQIKWPNDLLFDSKKLAGILCESKSFGTETEKNQLIFIGCGINIYADPDLTQTYQSISIKKIHPSFEEMSIDDLGASFFAFWKDKLTQHPIKNIEQLKDLFRLFHVPASRPFTDGKDLYYFYDIQNDGSLILSSGEKKVCLSSSQHGYYLVEDKRA